MKQLSHHLLHDTARRALVLLAGLAGAAGLWAQGVTAAPAEAWPVIGRQGIVRMVIVPLAQAADRSAYDRQLPALCDPEHTCFLNFYTNSQGVKAEVPVPDAIANEATATFRRSMKNGVEQFKWSCRMKLAVDDCF